MRRSRLEPAEILPLTAQDEANTVDLGFVGDILLQEHALEFHGALGATRAREELWAPLRGCPLIVANLEGPVTRRATPAEDKPYIHLHATVSDREGRAFGGHLFRGTITATGEMYILPSRIPLVRAKDPVEPFFLLDLPECQLEGA